MAEWFRFVRRGYHSFLYALLSILGFLQLLDVLKVEYVLFSHRGSSYEIFKLPFRVVLPLLILLGVWFLLMAFQKNFKVLVFPFLSLVVYPSLGFDGFISVFSLLAVVCVLWFYRDFESYLTWVFLIFGGFEALSLFHWLIFLPLGLITPFEAIAEFEMELSHVVMNLGPYLALILVLVSLLKPLNYLRERNKEFKHRDDNIVSNNTTLFLMIILLFSVLAGIYPYFQNINESGVDVGVDTRFYLPDVKAVEDDIFEIFKVERGSRPFFFLVVFIIQKLFNLEALTVIRYLPVFFNPLLTLSVYFFSKEIFNNKTISIWTAFFTVFGYPITVGIYSNFLTNLLGLCFAFLSIGFLFRSIRISGKSDFVLSILFAVLLIFTHPWTFVQYIITLVLSLFISYLLLNNEIVVSSKKGIFGIYIILLIFIIFIGLAELMKINFFQSYGIIKALSDIFNSVTSYTTFWKHLILGIKFRFGSLLLNIVSLCLMIVGILNLRFDKIQEQYLTIFMAATSAIFLIMATIIKSRLFYNIPVGVLSALGLKHILNRIKNITLQKSLIYFIILNLSVYLFRGLANLV